MKNIIILLIATAILFIACNYANQCAGLQQTIVSLKNVVTADRASEVSAILRLNSAWSAASEKNRRNSG